MVASKHIPEVRVQLSLTTKSILGLKQWPVVGFASLANCFPENEVMHLVVHVRAFHPIASHAGYKLMYPNLCPNPVCSNPCICLIYLSKLCTSNAHNTPTLHNKYAIFAPSLLFILTCTKWR